MLHFIPLRHRQLLSIVCLGLALPVAAGEIRPNCDIRQLGLDDVQRDKLQNRRQHYKDELRQIAQESRHRNDGNFRSFLVKMPFDRQQAQRIAQENHTADMQRTVAELSFYHDMFQLLNEHQQEIWLEKCIE